MADARPLAGWPLAALAVLSLAWALGAVLAVDPGSAVPTTYAAASPALRVADAVAGLALVAAGALACTQARARRLGLLAMLAGCAWFGPGWEGAEGSPPFLRSVGALVAPFTLALVLHLAVVAGGGARSRAARAAVVAAYAVTAAVSVGRALVRDPLLDLYCWRNCEDNSFLVHPEPGLASTLDDAWLWVTLAISAGLIAFAVQRLLTATPPARRAMAPLLAPAALAGVSEAAFAVALLTTPLEGPQRAGFAVVFLAHSLALGLLAAGLVWSAARGPRTRARLARLADELGEAPPPGKLRDALAAALGDPGVAVVYPRAGSSQLIDSDGRSVAPPAAGRAVARITRRGRPLALVLHDPALVDEPELERALGSATRLAVENEALRAEALAQVRELRASRARIVEAGDAERRRLERNLHDGAQQRLLALSYELRLGRAGAAAERDEPLAGLLDAAGGETAAALDELRELAHGIFPAILSEAGLAAALATLADDAPLPVELGDVEAARPRPAVETTAYFTVARAIADAHARGATFLSARVARDGDRLVIKTDDDGRPRRSSSPELADRVGALGGALYLGETSLRAELPCE